MKDLKPIKELLATPKKIVITTHHKPDGDALGSSLGLYHYLIKKNHEVQVITPSEYPENLHWLPSEDQVLNFLQHKEEAEKLTAQADLIFCLDFNTISRINEFAPIVSSAEAIKIMIDHHLEPQGFHDLSYSDESACATSELIYRFIYDLADENLMDKNIATCLYTGIMTDTGSFKYASANAQVYRIAADLIDKGAEHWIIQDKVYNVASENQLRFLGYVLLEKLKLIPEFHVAYIAITKEELVRFQVQNGETEGLVNYALSTKGVKLAALFIERAPQIKISLRSIADIPANEICKKYFNGGGHKNAAGGITNLSLEEATTVFKNALTNYKDILTKN